MTVTIKCASVLDVEGVARNLNAGRGPFYVS